MSLLIHVPELYRHDHLYPLLQEQFIPNHSQFLRLFTNQSSPQTCSRVRVRQSPAVDNDRTHKCANTPKEKKHDSKCARGHADRHCTKWLSKWKDRWPLGLRVVRNTDVFVFGRRRKGSRSDSRDEASSRKED